MIAKHYLDAVALYIHTDFDLVKDDEVLRAFVEKLESLEGVETINVGRFHMDISFGFLFNTQKCADKVLELFASFYAVNAGEPLSVEDILAKALRNASPEETSAIQTMSDFFKRGSLN